MLKEFKNFIMTGNVIDLAVAVILAGAVGMVVNGFVTDIMMPIVGHFSGGVDFADMKIVLSEAVIAADGTVTIQGTVALQHLLTKAVKLVSLTGLAVIFYPIMKI